MKVKKTFLYEGIELKIIERDEPYMNSPEPVKMTRVIAPNGGIIPINIHRKETLKSMVKKTINQLNGFKVRGADVKTILTQPLCQS